MNKYEQMMDDVDTLEFVLYVMESALIREKTETFRMGDALDQCEDAEYATLEREYVDQCEYEHEVRHTLKRVEQMLDRLKATMPE